MCPLYLIDQWQQIYVAKLRKKKKKSKPHWKPPWTRLCRHWPTNVGFCCLSSEVMTSRLKVPVFVFGHFSHSILILKVMFHCACDFLLRCHGHLPCCHCIFSGPWCWLFLCSPQMLCSHWQPRLHCLEVSCPVPVDSSFYKATGFFFFFSGPLAAVLK